MADQDYQWPPFPPMPSRFRGQQGPIVPNPNQYPSRSILSQDDQVAAPSPTPDAQGSALAGLQGAAPKDPITDYLMKIMSQPTPQGNAAQVPGLSQLKPAQLPDMPQEPQQNTAYVGHRPLMPMPGNYRTGNRALDAINEAKYDQMQREQDDAEGTQLQAGIDKDLAFQRQNYQNALKARTDMATGQQNTQFNAQADLAKNRDAVMQSAALTGVSPAEAAQREQVTELLKTLSPTLAANATARGNLAVENVRGPASIAAARGTGVDAANIKGNQAVNFFDTLMAHPEMIGGMTSVHGPGGIGISRPTPAQQAVPGTGKNIALLEKELSDLQDPNNFTSQMRYMFSSSGSKESRIKSLQDQIAALRGQPPSAGSPSIATNPSRQYKTLKNGTQAYSDDGVNWYQD